MKRHLLALLLCAGVTVNYVEMDPDFRELAPEITSYAQTDTEVVEVGRCALELFKTHQFVFLNGRLITRDDAQAMSDW